MKIVVALLILTLVSEAGVCRGKDPCKACRDCSKCWHCSPKNPKQGSCGTVRDQDGAASRKRIAKQAK